MKKAIRNAVVAASMLGVLAGNANARQDDFLNRLGFGVDFGGAVNSANVSIPESFGNVPPHANDPGSKTRRVKLDSGTYMSSYFGASVSPLPFNNFLSGFRLGYSRVQNNDKDVREGLSNMEWYEYGAYAGTYARLNMNSIDQFKVSYRHQIPVFDNVNGARFILEGGFNFNNLKAEVSDGWDRYYKEEARTSGKFSASSVNPFVSVGFGMGTNDDKGALIFASLFYENRAFEGNVPQGPVKIKEDVLGFNLRIGF
jgi:hypothetical protein